MDALSTLRELEQQKSRWESAIDNLKKSGHFSSGKDPGEEQTRDDKIMQALDDALKIVRRKIAAAKVAVRKKERRRVA